MVGTLHSNRLSLFLFNKFSKILSSLSRKLYFTALGGIKILSKIHFQGILSRDLINFLVTSLDLIQGE